MKISGRMVDLVAKNDFDLQFDLDLGVATHIFTHKFKGNIVLSILRYICKSQTFYMQKIIWFIVVTSLRFKRRPSWTPSWISQPAPTMATVSWQIYKLQDMTNILVYNIQCSTLVTTPPLTEP